MDCPRRVPEFAAERLDPTPQPGTQSPSRSRTEGSGRETGQGAEPGTGCNGSQRGPAAAERHRAERQSRARTPASFAGLGRDPSPASRAREPHAHPGVRQEARTLKPNSWPEADAAVTAAPGREEPSKRPVCLGSDCTESSHASLVGEPASRGQSQVKLSPPPSECLQVATPSFSVKFFGLEPGRRWHARRPAHPAQVPDDLGSTGHTQDFRETAELSWTGIPRKLGLGEPGSASCTGSLPRALECPFAPAIGSAPRSLLQGHLLGARDSEKLRDIPCLELPAR